MPWPNSSRETGYVVTAANWNEISAALALWGGNTDAAGYSLNNCPLITGGSATTSTLTLQATSGAGTTNSDIILKVGNNGAVEAMRIDSSGNVGIGTSSPATPLHIASGVSSSANLARIYAGSLSSGNSVDMYIGKAASSNESASFGFHYNSTPTSSYSYMSIYGDAASTGITVTPGGKVGIGARQSTYQLQLSTDSAAKPTTNTWTIASDLRLKTVKGEYQKGLAELCQVRPIRYEYNGKAGFTADGKEQISILAQELMQVFPECVGTFKGRLEEDGPEIDLYNYNGHAITFALINAIKELKAEIDILKARK